MAIRTDPPTPALKRKAPRFDPELLARTFAEKRSIRECFVPRGLSVYVDGVAHQDVDWANDACTIRLETGAGLIELVGIDDDNQKITVAAHFLTYDDTRSETCVADIPGLGEVHGKFTYYRDHTVRADFRLVEAGKWSEMSPPFDASHAVLPSLDNDELAQAERRHESRWQPQCQIRPQVPQFSPRRRKTMRPKGP